MAHMSWQLLALLLTFKTLCCHEMQNPYRHDLEALQEEPPLTIGAHRMNLADVEELWLNQKVDHFDASNAATWRMVRRLLFNKSNLVHQQLPFTQRYYRNTKYYRANGPIYIFIGGEWSITKAMLATGLMHDMAIENGGMLFYTEHRYYGQSWPVTNSSSANLRFLNVRQALADLAHFIVATKATNSTLHDAAVILVGGSYSGSIAAWMTRLYPALVTASWASSAPLLAKADFYEYMELVSAAISSTHSQACAQRIENGLLGFAKILQHKNASWALLKRFNACANFNESDAYDRAAFFNGIGNYFAYVVQSYSATIPKLCEDLLALPGSDASALAAYLTTQHGGAVRQSVAAHQCQDYSYEGMLAVFTDEHERLTGTRQWFYQTCNEFGWFTVTARTTTTTITTSSFGNQVPLRYFERLCLDAFGAEISTTSTPASPSSSSSSSSYTLANMSLGISQTNLLFGGNGAMSLHASNSTTTATTTTTLSYDNVIFTHGQLDPWRAVGQQSAPNAFIVPGYSHVADLSSIDAVRDSVAMSLSKLRIMSFLRRCLQSAKSIKNNIY